MASESPQFEPRGIPDPEIAAQMGGLHPERFEMLDDEEQLEPTGPYAPPVDERGAVGPEGLPDHWTAAERSAIAARDGSHNPDIRSRVSAFSVAEHAARIEQQTGDDGTYQIKKP